MAREKFDVEETTRLNTLLKPTAQAPDKTKGNYFDNSGGGVVMRIHNGSGTKLTVSVDYPGTYEDNAYQPNEKEVEDGDTVYFGPFPAQYNQPEGTIPNAVLVDFDQDAGVEVEVIRVPRAT